MAGRGGPGFPSNSMMQMNQMGIMPGEKNDYFLCDFYNCTCLLFRI